MGLKRLAKKAARVVKTVAKIAQNPIVAGGLGLIGGGIIGAAVTKAGGLGAVFSQVKSTVSGVLGLRKDLFPKSQGAEAGPAAQPAFLQRQPAAAVAAQPRQKGALSQLVRLLTLGFVDI